MFLHVFHRYSNSSPPTTPRHSHHGSVNDDRSQECAAIRPGRQPAALGLGTRTPSSKCLSPSPDSLSSTRRLCKQILLCSEWQPGKLSFVFPSFLGSVQKKGGLFTRRQNFLTLGKTTRASKLKVDALGAAVLGAKLKIGFLFSDSLCFNVLFPSCLLFLQNQKNIVTMTPDYWALNTCQHIIQY